MDCQALEERRKDKNFIYVKRQNILKKWWFECQERMQNTEFGEIILPK